MSVVGSIQKQFVPIHREGYPFIAAFGVGAFVLWLIWAPLGWLGLVVTVWCVYFFRDPPRVTPQRDGLIVSPADGYVCASGLFIPPPELGMGDRPLLRISVFMSVFDCHVNRSPVTGRITKIVYKPGMFLNADLDKASEDNERNGFVIETTDGAVGVVQIAGLIARRIVCFAKQGETVGAGDRLGLIRFGSRVDVYLPSNVTPLVGLGAQSVAGETILADMRAVEEPRTYRKG